MVNLALNFTLCKQLAGYSPQLWRAMCAVPIFGQWSITPDGIAYAERLYKKVIDDGEYVAHLMAGRLHRGADEPAIISKDGVIKIWCCDGRIHRDGDKPAYKGKMGLEVWYIDGLRHRNNSLPTVNTDYGSLRWHKNGKLHRTEGPARITDEGSQEWYENGILHRPTGGPARITHRGTCEWYLNGKLHRDGDKPARTTYKGRTEWYQHGVLKRGGGKPTVVYNQMYQNPPPGPDVELDEDWEYEIDSEEFLNSLMARYQ